MWLFKNLKLRTHVHYVSIGVAGFTRYGIYSAGAQPAIPFPPLTPCRSHSPAGNVLPICSTWPAAASLPKLNSSPRFCGVVSRSLAHSWLFRRSSQHSLSVAILLAPSICQMVKSVELLLHIIFFNSINVKWITITVQLWSIPQLYILAPHLQMPWWSFCVVFAVQTDLCSDELV